MNWKQFIRPNKKKVIIAFFLSIATFLLLPIETSFTFVDCGPCQSPPCDCGGMYVSKGFLLQEITNQFAGLSTIFGFNSHVTTTPAFQSTILENIFISIILSYLISCLIIWISDRGKK